MSKKESLPLKIVSDISTQEALELSQKILEENQLPPQSDKSASTLINGTSTSHHSDVTTLSIEDRLWILLREPEYFLHPKKWVRSYNQCKKITYDYKTESVFVDGRQESYETYMAEMRMNTKEMMIDKHLTKQALDDVVKVWMRDERIKFLDGMRKKLIYNPSPDDLVALWVQAATRRQDPCDIAVMRHFIWQVRRKLFGMQVDHHMMPILYGKTGGGKSRAVLELLKPMDDLTLKMDLSIFSDQFKMSYFSKAFVMFFDEMARSERADIDKLKNIITESVVEYRVMYSQKLESAPQNCTFIGASNDLVHDRIYDPTSARRYWQLNCADLLDWQTINSLDYLALWKSVDENAACPIIPHLSEIQKVQNETIRSKDPIEEWLLHLCKPMRSPYKTSTLPTSEELYASFKKWCEWQKTNKQIPFPKFSRQLPIVVDRIGWTVQKRHSNRGTIWPIKVDPTPDMASFINAMEKQKEEK